MDDRQQRIIDNLQRTLGQMEIALGTIREAIVWTDNQGNIQWCNRAFDKLLAQLHINILGKNIREVFRLHRKNRPVAHGDHPCDILEKKGTMTKMLYEYQTVDGLVFLEISANTVQIKGEEDIFIFFIQDISELKESQHMLRQVNENLEERIRKRVNQLNELSNRHAAILENAADAIITIDTAGTILSANPAAESMFGYSQKDLNGANVSLLMPEPYRREHNQYIKNYLDTGKSKIIGIGREVTGRQQDGTQIPLHLTISEVQLNDKKIFTGIIRNISKEKAALMELQAAKKQAERASRAKSDFIARISHEIRTPLNAILGMGDLLSESKLSEEQKKYIRVSRYAGDHLLGIINDLLDVARMESGKMELDTIPFNLTELVEDVIAIARLTAEKKDINVFHSIAQDVPMYLLGDPKRLRQVLLNLMGNSIKFTQTGDISLRISLQTEEADSKTVILLFAVKDSGIGIAKKMQDRIFDSFSQVDPFITRQYGGSGLGLTICKTLVHLMNGEISVESEPGNGATFTFTASLQRSTREAAEVEYANTQKARYANDSMVSKPARKRHLNILLAEDSADNRLLFSAFLKKIDCSLDMVENGQEAVEKCLVSSYDIILLDIQMPVMDGFTAVKKIRAKELPGEHIPIIALTAHAHEMDIQASLDAGFDRHIVKPVGKKTLLDTIYTLTQTK